MSEATKTVNTRVLVRSKSRHLWVAISEAKGWTFAETAHRIAEKFCEVEGIKVQSPKRRTPAPSVA